MTTRTLNGEGGGPPEMTGKVEDLVATQPDMGTEKGKIIHCVPVLVTVKRTT